MKKLLFVFIASIFLSGCIDSEPDYTKVVDYQITYVKKPKRMYVTLKDVTTGEEFERYVSKRCVNWRHVVVGSFVPLETDFYKNDETTKRVIKGVYSICPR